MSQFYTISQERHETVPQFIIRFQNLRRQLARKPPKDDVKETFFSALREPLRTTLAVFDFKEQSLEQVIDKALLMDKTQTCNNMSMMSLQKFVPMAKELRFRQGHTMHDMFKSRAFYSRMHTENTLSKLPMKVTYLVSKQCLIGKLVRWTLLLQAFEFNIIHRPGVQHAVAHYLS